MHNVRAAGGKTGTISVSVKSFIWIFLVTVTGRNNASIPRPEDAGDQTVHPCWNLGCFTCLKFSSDYPSVLLAPVLMKGLFSFQKEFGKVFSTTYISRLQNTARV